MTCGRRVAKTETGTKLITGLVAQLKAGKAIIIYINQASLLGFVRKVYGLSQRFTGKSEMVELLCSLISEITLKYYGV